MKDLLYKGLEIKDGPYIIRYPRGLGEGTAWRGIPAEIVEIGKSERLLEGSEVAVLALGPVAHRALEAAMRLEKETGKRPSVYNVRFLKPFDLNMMEEISAFKAIITVEDGALIGGLFSEVSEYVSSHGLKSIVKGLGVPDKFISQAPVREQRELCGLDADSIYSSILKLLKNN